MSALSKKSGLKSTKNKIEKKVQFIFKNITNGTFTIHYLIFLYLPGAMPTGVTPHKNNVSFLFLFRNIASSVVGSKPIIFLMLACILFVSAETHQRMPLLI